MSILQENVLEEKDQSNIVWHERVLVAKCQKTELSRPKWHLTNKIDDPSQGYFI
jgi:hypothetical protein